MSNYLVFERATGRVIGSIVAETKPTVMAHHDTIASATIPGDLATVKVVNGGIVPVPLDPTVVEVQLLQKVRSEAEKRKMMMRSPGGGKNAEYRQKRAEAVASSAILPAVLNALSVTDAAKQYPAATIEAKLTGEKLDVVLKRYRIASDASDAEVYRLAAIEHTAIHAIQHAATAAAKQSAYDAINWSWTG